MNISKIRLFPENDYESYEWNKKERGTWVNIWFRKPDFIAKNKKVYPRNEYWTIKKVDKETANHLYLRIWNPVSLRIMNNYHFIKGLSIFPFWMKVQLHSIDDSSYGIWFEAHAIKILEDIRLEIMNWIDSKNLLNGEDLLNFCEKLGGKDKDYN